MAKLTIEVSAEEFEKACEKAYQKQKNRIQLPGFRKGKAPRKMIENMYGKEVFYEDAANDLIMPKYVEAVKELIAQDETFQPIARPELILNRLKKVKILSSKQS